MTSHPAGVDVSARTKLDLRSEACSFFLADGRGGQRHAVLHGPVDRRPSRLVVHVPAFGMEMNFSRRHLAQVSRELAAAGAEVMLLDLLGCGDSSGESIEASWSAWADDLVRAAHWLWERHPDLPRWVWAQRAGALVVAAAWPRLAGPHVLLWQAVPTLADLRTQWERQAVASAIARGEPVANAVQRLRAAWREGYAPEVGGTSVPATLACDDTLPTLRTLAPAAGARMHWMDLGGKEPAAPGRCASAVLEAWTAAGGAARWSHAACAPFWQVAEAERSQTLGSDTVRALQEHA